MVLGVESAYRPRNQRDEGAVEEAAAEGGHRLNLPRDVRTSARRETLSPATKGGEAMGEAAGARKGGRRHEDQAYTCW